MMRMNQKNSIIYFKGIKYIIVESTNYMGNKYIFVMNLNNVKDIKILVCLNELQEVDDILLIRKIIMAMKIKNT